MLPTLSTTALLLSCLGLGAQAALDGHCPPLGAVLPPPTRPSTHKAIPSAAAKLKAILDQMSATYNNSAVSIGVKSIHEDDLMFEYAHTPANKEKRGAQTIDSDTVFRLGSLTKVFPVLALLKLHDKGVRLDDPITKYVPELRGLRNEGREDNAIWDAQWDDVEPPSRETGCLAKRPCMNPIHPPYPPIHLCESSMSPHRYSEDSSGVKQSNRNLHVFAPVLYGLTPGSIRDTDCWQLDLERTPFPPLCHVPFFISARVSCLHVPVL
jgi:hypothetical protein